MKQPARYSCRHSFKKFRVLFHNEIDTVVNCSEFRNCRAENERKRAKKQFDVFIDKCVRSSGDSESIVIISLINLLVDRIDNAQVQRILGPVFNCR